MLISKLSVNLALRKSWQIEVEVEKTLTLPPLMLTSLFYEYLDLKSVLGRHCVRHALLKTAKEFSIGIFANPINQAAFPRFVQRNMQSKQMHINSRTEKEGVLGGLIECQEAHGDIMLKPLIEYIGNTKIFAVERGGEKIYVRTLLPNDKPILAGCYPTGDYVTSDIDLTVITHTPASNTNRCRDNDPYGELTCHDKNVILAINHNFQIVIQATLGTDETSPFDLVSHGPSCEFSRSKQSHLHFPMLTFLPDGTVTQFGTESDRTTSLCQFVNWRKYFQKINQNFRLNPLWKLERDESERYTTAPTCS